MKWLTPLILIVIVSLPSVGATYDESKYKSASSKPHVIGVQDNGIVSELGGMLDIDAPTMLSYKGKKRMWMSGAVDRKTWGYNGIYYSSNDRGDWSKPTLAFAKKGYMLSDPSIIKHPVRNQLIMFYTMRSLEPVEKVIRVRGKKKKVLFNPKNYIGVAYANSCRNSPDDSGMCWTDLSDKRPLIGKFDDSYSGGYGPSAYVDGARVNLYYKTERPGNAIMRSVVDLRDWRIWKTDPITIQSYDIMKKEWNTVPPQAQLAIQDVDVKPFGGEIMMVANDGYLGSISRLVSKNGINFHRLPEDNNGPFLVGGLNHVKAPFLEPIGKDRFRLYYAMADAENDCSKRRKAAGNRRLCAEKIQVREYQANGESYAEDIELDTKEEVDPKLKKQFR